MEFTEDEKSVNSSPTASTKENALVLELRRSETEAADMFKEIY